MKSQKAELLKQLPKHGWAVTEVKDEESEWFNLEWWEDEIWILESVWSPNTSKLYLTFLVDPQAPIHGRKRGEGIWAVKASVERLEDWKMREEVVFLGLNHGWENQLPDFFKGLSDLRNRSEETLRS